MSIGITNLILLLAAAQGLFLSVLIFHKHGNLFANRFLGTLIFLYSIILLHLLLGELGYGETHPFLVFLIIGLAFVVGPLHYLYAKYLVHQALNFKKTDWLHFIPFLCYEGYRLFTFLVLKENYLPIVETKEVLASFIVFHWVVIIHISLYLFLTILILNRYARYIKDVFSTIEKIKLDWLRNITYMAAVFLLIYVIETSLLSYGINLSTFNLTSFLMAVYVYAIGYLGLFKAEVFTSPEIAASIGRLPELSYQSRLDAHQKSKKYEKSGLTPERAKVYLQNLLQLMKEKQPYTNSNLTLNQLAEMLSISPHNLSEILNTQLHQNFFDFVNHYRIEKVKQDLVDPEKKHLKILALAFEAGFNSKSSFNALFKKHTQLTPSEYRQRAIGTKL